MDISSSPLFKTQAFVDGQWIAADEGKTLEVTNPATESLLGTIPEMSTNETRRAIDVAQRALPAWRALPAKERSQYLRAWYQAIMDEQETLAAIMSAEQGKPFAEAKGEIAYAASFLQWFAEEGKRVYGETIPAPQSQQRLMVLKQPIGVCAAITPWNFPAAMITRKVAPALAAGCTMVVRPANETPFTALALMELANRVGIPAGVINMVTGDAKSIGKEMTENPVVRKLTFTGSTRVGSILMSQAAGDIKKLSLELGGNAPFIVFDDADIDAAVEGAMHSKFRNAGQTCVCTNRILVHDAVYDEFVEKFTAATRKLVVGEAFESGVDLGPLINEAALEKCEELIADATSKGAKVLLGGTRHERGGNYFTPTIIGDATDKMNIAYEETFGPVAPIFRFSDEQQAIAMANDTEFGLASYFYSQDLGRMFRVGEALEYGMVGINTGAISNEVAPFGGVKASGLGREGSHHGIEDYLELKYLCIDGLGL